MRPKNKLEVHVDVLDEDGDGSDVEERVVGGGVMACRVLVELVELSQQPQKKPGVWHTEVVGGGVAVVPVLVFVGSLHPNHPGLVHVVVGLGTVVVGAGVGICVVEVVVVGSLHPNQPGVLHVEVVLVEVVEVVVAVVVSSRHPHHPGVLHVDVLVKVGEVVMVVVVVVPSEPLLLKNFHR